MLKGRRNSPPEEDLLVLGGKSRPTVPEWKTHLFIPVKLVFGGIVA